MPAIPEVDALQPATSRGGRRRRPPATHARPRGRRDKKHRRQRQVQPPERLCHACAEFLKDRKTLETPCSQCGTAIYWPPESQLQTHLGNWATPSLCGACKRDATEAARRAAKEALRQQVIDAAPHPIDAASRRPTRPLRRRRPGRRTSPRPAKTSRASRAALTATPAPARGPGESPSRQSRRDFRNRRASVDRMGVRAG